MESLAGRIMSPLTGQTSPARGIGDPKLVIASRRRTIRLSLGLNLKIVLKETDDRLMSIVSNLASTAQNCTLRIGLEGAL
jgi:hypothetical protein